MKEKKATDLFSVTNIAVENYILNKEKKNNKKKI